MPKQEEHERIENLVEDPHRKGPRPARSLAESVNSDNRVESVFALNSVDEPEAREAVELDAKPRQSPEGNDEQNETNQTSTQDTIASGKASNPNRR